MKFSMLIPAGYGAARESQLTVAIAAMAGALEVAKVDPCFMSDHPGPPA